MNIYYSTRKYCNRYGHCKKHKEQSDYPILFLVHNTSKFRFVTDHISVTHHIISDIITFAITNLHDEMEKSNFLPPTNSYIYRRTLFSNTESIYGSMSLAFPHLAEPYSTPCRNFLAFLAL